MQHYVCAFITLVAPAAKVHALLSGKSLATCDGLGDMCYLSTSSHMQQAQ